MKTKIAGMIPPLATALVLTLDGNAEAQGFARRDSGPPDASLRAEDEGRDFYYGGRVNAFRYDSPLAPREAITPAQRRAFFDRLAGLLLGTEGFQNFSMFVIGEAWDHLIVVSTTTGQFGNEFQARSFLSALLPIIRVNNLAPNGAREVAAQASNFYDLASALGLTRVTVSEGDLFTLEARLE